MQRANHTWMPARGGSKEKLSFPLAAVAKIPKHLAALFHHCFTPFQHKKCTFFFGKKMNVTLVKQIAVGEP